MGREVRRVPKDWQHPRYTEDDAPSMRAVGHYKALFEGDAYEERKREWEEAQAKGGLQHAIEEHGSPPDARDYMPNWPKAERTHLMMYEDTSEGTPISPAFETPEELARWLADNNASACGSEVATYEQWLRMIGAGWAPSMVMDSQGVRSGVAA